VGWLCFITTSSSKNLVSFCQIEHISWWHILMHLKAFSCLKDFNISQYCYNEGQTWTWLWKGTSSIQSYLFPPEAGS
jgi:hypothetical protein